MTKLEHAFLLILYRKCTNFEYNNSRLDSLSEMRNRKLKYRNYDDKLFFLLVFKEIHVYNYHYISQ